MMHRGVRSVMFGFLCLMVWVPGTVFGGEFYTQTNLVTGQRHRTRPDQPLGNLRWSDQSLLGLGQRDR